MTVKEVEISKNRLKSLIQLMRPREWLKNGFVLSGILFAHAWNDPVLLTKVLLGTLAFCLVSSGAYIFNDYRDVEKDRLHEKKRSRPLAAGEVTLPVAFVLMSVLWGLSFWIGYQVSNEAVGILATYLTINILYSIWLKNIVLVDVFSISFCFLLRIFMGTVAVGIAPSDWLILCGMMLTLFLGFSKRRAEMGKNQGKELKTRKVFKLYSIAMLDQIMILCATCAIMSYALYTMSPKTIAMHGSQYLVLTVPFVTFGILRYISLIHRLNIGEELSRELVRDVPLILCVLGWVGLVIWLII